MTETEQGNRKLPLRVVVADDHPGMLNRLISILESEFLVVVAAENGQLALERVKEYRPDVVILDLEMPVLDGVATTRELKKLPFAPAVVICSVQNDPAIVEAAHQAGAMGYVFKTCINQDLIEAVKSAARGEYFVSSHCERSIRETEDALSVAK